MTEPRKNPLQEAFDILLPPDWKHGKMVAREVEMPPRQCVALSYTIANLCCAVTGNPCGTDTHAAGVPCACAACQRWLCDELARREHHHATLRAAALRVLEAHGTGQGLEAALRALGAVVREGE